MNEAGCSVGIDVSKRKLDVALLMNGKTKSRVFDNTPAGHASLTVSDPDFAGALQGDPFLVPDPDLRDPDFLRSNAR